MLIFLKKLLWQIKLHKIFKIILIKYQTGAIENNKIRKEISLDVLEGGENAIKKRNTKLNVT